MSELTGRVRTGVGEANRFIELPWVRRQLAEALGSAPYPGTLNLEIDGAGPREIEAMALGAGSRVILPAPGFCEALCRPVALNGLVPGVIVFPRVADYPPGKLEIVSPFRLRPLLGVDDGDTVRLRPLGPGEGSPRRAILFDLEGTLVDFQWKLGEAEAALRKALTELGFDPAPLAGLDYGLLRRHAYLAVGADKAARKGIDDALDPIYDHYDADALTRWALRPGAKVLLDRLAAHGAPVALVSNIGRKAASALLEKFGLAQCFRAVVTRSDVEMFKPDAEALLRAMAVLGASAGETIMVGDSLTDLKAARGAGLPVALVHGGESLLRPLEGACPDLQVETLEELSALLFWTLPGL